MIIVTGIDQELISKAVKEAMIHRERARTFRSKVGTCLVTKDGRLFGGCNLESYPHKGYHAEEMSLLRGLADGYNGTDFLFLAEIFQDAGHQKTEIFPACLYCWAVLWEFTHPDLFIIVANTEGIIQYATKMSDIVHPEPPGEVYPSELVRRTKPKMGTEPRLVA